VDGELQALDERACELCVFTSGSTGQPSAISKRLDQLAREVDALQAAFGAQLEGVQVHGTVSHQHIYGLLFRVLWPLAAGRLIHPRRFFHEDLVGALAGTDTVLVATPAHLKRLPEQLDWASLHGRLRAVFSSGGPLPEEAARQVRQWLGVAPTEVYGSSETGGIAWRRWDTDLPPWQPLPGVQWRIEDGCLAVASAHLETSTGGAPRTAWKRWPMAASACWAAPTASSRSKSAAFRWMRWNARCAKTPKWMTCACWCCRAARAAGSGGGAGRSGAAGGRRRRAPRAGPAPWRAPGAGA
jgi:acyl-coenzyme A synthetase/AMP-(fatty) acid ligase